MPTCRLFNADPSPVNLDMDRVAKARVAVLAAAREALAARKIVPAAASASPPAAAPVNAGAGERRYRAARQYLAQVRAAAAASHAVGLGRSDRLAGEWHSRGGFLGRPSG